MKREAKRVKRTDGRQADEMRTVNITRNYNKYAEGSVLIEMGDTKVICIASVENKVPPFMRGQGKGWVTAEYAMLPRATQSRNIRESSKGKVGGRTMEIQRLIGRALRSVIDLDHIGERTLWVDCDVIQADGGTRTASITGAFIAVMDALQGIREKEKLEQLPIRDFLAAISVGVVGEQPLLDLCYEEDSQASVDMNLVMTGNGEFVEIQGTGEDSPFSPEQFQDLIEHGKKGIAELVQMQKEILGMGGAIVRD